MPIKNFLGFACLFYLGLLNTLGICWGTPTQQQRVSSCSADLESPPLALIFQDPVIFERFVATYVQPRSDARTPLILAPSVIVLSQRQARELTKKGVLREFSLISQEGTLPSSWEIDLFSVSLMTLDSPFQKNTFDPESPSYRTTVRTFAGILNAASDPQLIRSSFFENLARTVGDSPQGLRRSLTVRNLLVNKIVHLFSQRLSWPFPAAKRKTFTALRSRETRQLAWSLILFTDCVPLSRIKPEIQFLLYRLSKNNPPQTIWSILDQALVFLENGSVAPSLKREALKKTLINILE